MMERSDRLAILAAAADAAKGHDRADVGTSCGECGDLARDVEIGLLDTDGCGHAHRRGLFF